MRAAAAIVRHAVDVGARGRIGLGRHHPAIGMDGHAVGVRQFHPFEGVGVDREVPGVDLGGRDAGEQREIARHHQPLDVVRVGEILRLRDRLADTAHRRRRAPVEAGQRAGGAERVLRRIARHKVPVDAADVLSPAEDLADEAFHGIERGAARAPGVFRRPAGLHRVEQADVEAGRNKRVEHRRLPGGHRILVVAEQRQAVADEGIKRRARLLRRDRPGEAVHIAEMGAKAGGDQRHHLPRDGIRGEARRGGRHQALGQRRAVFGIEVPLPADGLVAFHQQAGLAAHLAVEEFHAVLLPPRCPGAEARQRTEEARVLPDLDRHAGGVLPALHVLQHAPFARMRCHDARGAMVCGGAQHLAAEGLGVGRVVQPHMVDPHAAGGERAREVPHGGQHEDDLLRMVRDVGAFLLHLHQQHHVAFGIEPVERGKVARALVPQHHAQGGAGHAGASLRSRRISRATAPWTARHPPPAPAP